jgi:hypothetical protein
VGEKYENIFNKMSFFFDNFVDMNLTQLLEHRIIYVEVEIRTFRIIHHKK